MARFDWPALMRAGIGGLRLTPADFWALTPAELSLLLGEGRGQSALTRAGFDALLRAYPDKYEEPEDG
ncbi:phage tail assembly chaperone [Shimia sp. R9_2]|uniref:rcc01693 family protein n=1 Tax=unclassified Shimia TaxID=2630038 RepID=UPI001ADBA30B|nr:MULTISPECIES: rcc01693 family protein [unclassified Shimia]MBO9396823.1 phage tail assembly chaperone [Shimia sp. R9_2]MBO9401730.1 phage tail assembly chaperone [Shimia sp. R9_3]